jgi:hypothetical protein
MRASWKAQSVRRLAAGTERRGLASRVPDRHAFSMRFDWKQEKNAWLRQHRQIAFEQIIFHLGRGDVWKTTLSESQKVSAPISCLCHR